MVKMQVNISAKSNESIALVNANAANREVIATVTPLIEYCFLFHA